MKILVGSHRFSPEVGGIETASALLATEFAALGHEVKLLTATAGTDQQEWPFEVIRRPSCGLLLDLARWSEVFFQNNISLQSLWAAVLCRKPWVVTHQTWITKVNGELGWRDHLKRFLLRFATNVAISHAVAEDIGGPSVVVGNPYCDDVFQQFPGSARDRDLVFLGRFVSDKGLDLLIEALAILRREGMTPRLTIVGTGPEESAIRDLADVRGVVDQVEFAGLKAGRELAELLNRHEIMVVPSRWAEPFGIVALEGIACGCVVVGSEDGGLKEAIGPCGLTFANGSIEGLAAALRRALREPELRELLRSHRETHLARFEATNVAREYLGIFGKAVR